MHRSRTLKSHSIFSLILLLLLFIQPLVPKAAAQIKYTEHTALTAPDRYTKSLDRGKPSTALLPYWQSLRAASQTELRAFWYDRGILKSVYGRMVDVSQKMSHPESAARQFLREHAALFQLRSLADLRLIQQAESPGGTHLFFEQVYQGVRVHGGGLSVSINPRGVIDTVTNNYHANIEVFSVVPSVSAEAVSEQLFTELASHTGQLVLYGQPTRELVIAPTDAGAYLAWRIVIPAREPQGLWEAFFDAHTGERISQIMDKNYYVNGTGKVFVPNPVVALNDTTIRDTSTIPEAAYTTKTLFDLDGSGFLNGPFVNTQNTPSRVNRPTNDFSDLRRGQNGFEEVMTYWAMDTTKRYFDALGFFTVMNYSIPVNAEGSNDCNAFFSPGSLGQGSITLHSPVGSPNAAEDADVIWHEYGHAVMHNQRIGIDQNFDGQGEGFGDFLAAMMSNREGPAATHTTYDPCLAEWFSQCFTSVEPACLRRMDNPPSIRQWPRDRGGVHFTGQTWSASLYDLFLQLGRDTTVSLVLDSHFRLPLTPAMPESAEAVSQADDALYGGSHQTTINSVFTARGLFPQPYRITSPTNGDVLYIGANHLITWTTSRSTPTVKLMISRSGGSGGSFTDIAVVPNTGSFNWTVTGPPTTQAVIRIREQADGDAFRDHSTGMFTISNAPPPPATITVTSPNGGETWQIGTTQTVTWTTTGSIANVHIELSHTGAAGPYTMLASNTPNDGSQSITVPGPATTNAFIRVSDAANPATQDTSNAAFTISATPPPASITVTAPNGGETWQIGTTQTISWTTTGSIANVKIELSRDGGSTYSTLFTSTPNDGSESWTVTGPATTQARV
ncbi:MAG: M36 family metallopeptidase, partial [Acidobacteriota bacterium]|nr:M36 family metallopeptidase [Acidobacteriota bacterium]